MFNLGYTSHNYHASESCKQTFLTNILTFSANILKSQINFFSYNSTFFCLKNHDLKKLNINYKLIWYCNLCSLQLQNNCNVTFG